MSTNQHSFTGQKRVCYSGPCSLCLTSNSLLPLQKQKQIANISLCFWIHQVQINIASSFSLIDLVLHSAFLKNGIY